LDRLPSSRQRDQLRDDGYARIGRAVPGIGTQDVRTEQQLTVRSIAWIGNRAQA
jgi:hypothetical protein